MPTEFVWHAAERPLRNPKTRSAGLSSTIDGVEDAVLSDLRDGDATEIADLLDRHQIQPPLPPDRFKKVISDQRARRYQEYESGELLFNEAQQRKAEAVTADGNRDVMTFDSD